jgi:hypothetical protein
MYVCVHVCATSNGEGDFQVQPNSMNLPTVDQEFFEKHSLQKDWIQDTVLTSQTSNCFLNRKWCKPQITLSKAKLKAMGFKAMRKPEIKWKDSMKKRALGDSFLNSKVTC